MANERVQLSEPLLEQKSQYEKEHDILLGRLRDGKQGLLAAAASHTGLSYARTRSLVLQKKLRRENQAKEAWCHWPVAKLRQFSRDKLPVTLPVKAGLAALIASLLCFAPGFLSVFNKNGVWAVITVDIVMETNVGLTFSKGLNRTLGTLMAALLALLVDVLGYYMGSYEKYFLFICTFLGGAIPTMFKFRQPFRDRWNYAVVMSMITFHLLILTQSNEKTKLPLLRLGLIAIGFVIASLVNVILLPNFAGNNINDLLATNFERAGNIIERSVMVYCQGTVLQQHPESLNHATNDDLHPCFHEIMAADSEVDKLLKAARFEPPHGKFFMGYPWHLYQDLGENLRFSYYDIIALDSTLRAEIQAPFHLRTMFQTEFMALGKESAEVFRALGKTMRHMKKLEFHKLLDRVEEIALLLQHKIAKQADLLLQLSRCYSNPPEDNRADAVDGFLTEVLEAPIILSESSDDDSSILSGAEQIRVTETTLPEQRHEVAQGSKERQKKFENMSTFEDRADLLNGSGSIEYHWECTVQRLAALSLLKFASLLIEIAAKAKYVVGVVDELAEKAHFDNPTPGDPKPSDEFVSPFGAL